MSSPRIGNLVVYSGEVRAEDLVSPNLTRYKIVEAMVHLALSLLETPEASRSLADVATAIIQARDKSRSSTPRHIYRDSMQNMPYWIQRFLGRMRANFPPVCISGYCMGEAEAQRRDWGMDMDRYDAGPDAGTMFVSEAIISNMLYLLEQGAGTTSESYKLFKFQMTISVAHEILHFLTGFLTGTPRPNTPRDVTARPYNRPNTGEAGRFWESRFLGGFLECWSVPSDPLGFRQPGQPFLFNEGSRSTSTGEEVSMAYVEELLKGQFTFPIRKSSRARPVTRPELESGGSCETTELRKSRDSRRAGPGSSPPPGLLAADVRYRRITPGPASGYTVPERAPASRRFFR